MQRNFEHNTSSSRSVTRHNLGVPSISINREMPYQAPNVDRSSSRHAHNRSFSNNISYVKSNGDDSRIERVGPFREYGDYNKSNITHITSNGNTSVMTEAKKERKLDYEIKYRDDNIKKLEADNSDLKREVHRLRKIEAGWGVGGNKQIIEETKIHNTYIVENNNLKIEVEEYRAKYMELENIIDSLEEEKRELERQLQLDRKESSQETVLRKEVERLKIRETTEIKKISEEKIRIEEERKKLREERDKTREEKEKYKVDRDRYRGERDMLRQKLKTLEMNIEGQRENTREKERERERERMRETRVEESSKYRELEEELRRKNEEVRRFQTDIESLRRTKSERTGLESQISELNVQINQLSQENQFLHKKLAILEGVQKGDRRVEYSDSERVQELERLLEMYKSRLSSRDDQINSLRKDVEVCKDEAQRHKITREEIEIKSRVGSSLEYKKEMQKTKIMKIRAEELESRVKHLEYENKRLRDVLQQSGVRVENNVYIEKEVYNNGRFNNEIEDMGVKAVLKELEMERFKKNTKDPKKDADKSYNESINDSWKAIH